MDERRYVDAGEPQTLWEAHARLLHRAQAARAQLLRNTFITCLDRLRTQICARAERLRITLCPLCCH